MTQVTLGRTGIKVNKNGFGALPIQRVSKEQAAFLLHKALDNGITFFDTARMYTDSEEKMGAAFVGMRDKVVIATKTMATDTEAFWSDLETSLRLLGTDHVDLYQFHNPPFCPLPGDGSGLYEAMQKAREQGKIRFIGITNHRLHVAREAIASALYDTLQFPFCYLTSEKELELVQSCKEADIGFIAMKALSGGIITNSAAAYAFLAQYDHVLPIWGIQREEELDEFLSYIHHPPTMDENITKMIESDRSELLGNFCRSCGYCLPCPADIEIFNCARMSHLIRRMPTQQFLTPEMQAKMKKIEDCIHCGSCVEKCPYNLDPPQLLQANYRDYQEILAGKPL